LHLDYVGLKILRRTVFRTHIQGEAGLLHACIVLFDNFPDQLVKTARHNGICERFRPLRENNTDYITILFQDEKQSIESLVVMLSRKKVLFLFSFANLTRIPWSHLGRKTHQNTPEKHW